MCRLLGLGPGAECVYLGGTELLSPSLLLILVELSLGWETVSLFIDLFL